VNEVPTRVVIVGSGGRLGARIVALAETRSDVAIVAALGRADEDPDAAADVVIDVAGPVGAARAIAIAGRLGAPLLQASTGLAARDEAARDALADRIAVLVAPNLSFGVAMLRELVAVAVKRLPEHWTLDIVDIHHAGKRDAPSGTARAVAQSAEAAGRVIPPDRIHSLRSGGVVGEHEIILGGPQETIRLRHEAGSRDLFAVGALDAARWLHGRSPGRYAMEDVLAGG
jgi:4-hydroxy-tetrahydrodipicolinate reductase